MTPVQALEQVPFLDLAATHDPMRQELHAALDDVLNDSSFIGGPHVEAFEAALAARVQVDYAVGVASGTAALQLALVAAGVGPGDEVVLPPNTFFATAEAVIATGATPVLADVDETTALLDVDAAAAAITQRTAAIIPVHLYGQPVDGERFSSLARRHGLFLLEDACQALDATWNDRPAGSMGTAGAFSFYPGKNLGALGDAGAVTTNDATLARRVRALRSHGEVTKHHHEVWSYCERIDGLQAAFLEVKLGHLDAAQARRREVADWYRVRLTRLTSIGLLDTAPGARHAHHLMVVRAGDRDAVLERLHEAGISAAVHYPTPIHLQEGATGLGRRGQFPSAEALSRSVLSLPLWPGMTERVIDRVVDALATATAEGDVTGFRRSRE